jgi:branched-chain amino acid transport system permease protein
VLQIINLSHGVIIVLGAYFALVLRRLWGVDPLIGLPAVAALCFAVGYAYQRYLISPAIRRVNILYSPLVTYGVALVAQNGFSLVFSPDNQSILPEYAHRFFRIDGVTINLLQVAFVASLALMGLLALLLRRFPLGRILRAVAEQPLAARLCGVNIAQIHALTFGLSAAFAGAAGVLIGMLYPFAPTSQENWTLYGFVVVVLGGAGSAVGALLGGLMLGIIGALTSEYIGAAYPNAVVFLVLVLMLMVKPNGLLGSAFGGLALMRRAGAGLAALCLLAALPPRLCTPRPSRSGSSSTSTSTPRWRPHGACLAALRAIGASAPRHSWAWAPWPPPSISPQPRARSGTRAGT